MVAKKETPLMKQYNGIKEQYPDAILLFRVGDFYETFGEDAIVASKVLGIVLTKRSNGAASEMELAGFPHHALNNYLPKLVKAGYRVAICDQLEDPKLTKKIVKRGVSEVITPGVTFNDEILDYKQNNFLAAIHFDKKAIGLAFVDVSTGEFMIAEGTEEYILKLLHSFKPKELLHLKRKRKDCAHMTGGIFYMYGLEDWVFKHEYAFDELCKHFKVKSLKGFGIQNKHKGIIAAGAILSYLGNTQHHQLEHISSIQPMSSEDYVWIDQFTINNLELIYPSQGGGHSLLSVLDKTQTPMGGRLLKRWILLPLKDKTTIEERLNIVENLIKDPDLGDHIEAALDEISDLERLVSKLSLRKISPRAFRQLLYAHEAIEKIKQTLSRENSTAFKNIEQALKPLSELQSKIHNTLVDEPPISLDKGLVIRTGVSKSLDELRDIQNSGKQYLENMRNREVESTGIPNLKIAFNNVFGYYIEVRNTHKDKVPEHWIRKQTLVNAERYITEELKQYEEKILNAEGEIRRLESALYIELIDFAYPFIVDIQKNANQIASLDCLNCFAKNAIKNSYRKPVITESKSIDIKDGRHPVIEQQLDTDNPYIANDIYLDDKKQQIMMITGPNMAGKSALLRQVALITIMAQMGSFVPASKAEIGLVDRVFTRVGASDNISSGESTFMVEMNETASIINNLSERSLVLLDEIGRGTSTFDGVSLAWSITEYLHHHPCRPKTLFATHYHELNELANTHERIENYNVSVKEVGQKIIFLRKLAKGGSEHSFGIHVAEIAGMPKAIINRANEVLQKLEESRSGNDNKEALQALPSNLQMNLFQWEDPKVSEVIKHLESVDINNLTPMDAMLKFSEIQKKLKED